jgi:hypothetical protein
MCKWESLYKKIGPLRYQSSTHDCVPTTVINALTVLFERQLHPKLLHLIWSLSMDGDKGTGWVCCDVLSTLLSKWFERAHQDGYEKEKLPFTSKIIEDESVHLGKSNQILRCLNSGGVACLSTATHYYLILGVEDDNFLLFDCCWHKSKTPKQLKELDSYKGLVNTRWSRGKLEDDLSNFKWVHLLCKKASEDVTP